MYAYFLIYKQDFTYEQASNRCYSAPSVCFQLGTRAGQLHLGCLLWRDFRIYALRFPSMSYVLRAS